MDDAAQGAGERRGISCRANHQILRRVPGRNIIGLLPRDIYLRLAGSFQAAHADFADYADNDAVVIADVDMTAEWIFPRPVALDE